MSLSPEDHSEPIESTVSLRLPNYHAQDLTDSNEQNQPINPETPILQHSDLRDWPSRQFFSGHRSGPKYEEGITPVGRTIRQFFCQLKGAKVNDRCRMGIDISGPQAILKTHGDTSSFYNEEEAQAIVGLVSALLAYQPAFDPRTNTDSFSNVKPGDIGIFNPYEGQCQRIRDLLFDKGQSSPESQVLVEGVVSTTSEAAEMVCTIAFISLCLPHYIHPTGNSTGCGTLESAASQRMLRIQNTRACQCQVSTGNFQAWLKPILKGSKKVRKRHKSVWKHFSSFIMDHCDMRDIVSWEDVQQTLLAAPAPMKFLDKSHFYTTVLPALEMKMPQQVQNKKSKQEAQHSVPPPALEDEDEWPKLG